MTAASSSLRPHLSFLAVAFAVVGTAFALWGQARGWAAAAGAGLAFANWLLVRLVGARLFASTEAGASPQSSRAALSFLLMAKIGALMAVVYFLMQRVQLDPVGLAFGLGVMFIGPLVASILAHDGERPLSPSAATAVRKER